MALALLVWVQAALGTARAAERRNISLTYEFANPQVVTEDGYCRVSIAGCAQHAQPGEPVLPFRTAHILLPPGYGVQKVRVEGLEAARSTRLKSKVEFGRSPSPLGEPRPRLPVRPVPDKPNAKIYGSSSPYPATRAQLASVQRLCGYQIAFVRLFPAQYVPRSGQLVFSRRVRLTLELSPEPAKRQALPAPRRGRAPAARVAALVDNPALLAEYDTVQAGAAALAPGAGAQLSSGQAYDYLLITSDALKDYFDTLVAQKVADGLSVKTETVEHIYATTSGTDDPDRIRNYIRDAYTNWGVQYVLLGGDAGVVPKRDAYGYVVGVPPEEQSIPCDLYYSCLDGTWNGNGNGIWGEATDGDGGGDVDLMSEVYVGRAPVDTPAEVATFVSKIVSYEQNGTANRNNALFLAEYTGSSIIPPSPAYQGGRALDKLTQNGYFDGYTVDKLDDRPYYTPQWDAADCIAKLNDSPHIVVHFGHGNEQYVMRMLRPDVDSLTNQHLFLLNSAACHCGAFDYSDCIGEDFSKRNQYGAFAVIMNTRYGWYDKTYIWHWSGEFLQTFYKRLLTDGFLNVGLALQLSKEDMFSLVETTPGVSSPYRWCYFTITLLGDPHTALKAATTKRTLDARSFDASISVNAYQGGVAVTVSPAPDGVTPFARSYAASAAVTLTAPATHGNLSFIRWKLDGVDQAQGATELPLTMNADHAVVAVYEGPPPLIVDMDVFQAGPSVLNPTGPAPRSLTLLSITMPDDPGTDEIAITVDGGTTWLRFVEHDPAGHPGEYDVYTDGAAAEWHTAAEWANRRIRGLAPGSTCDFQAKCRPGPGQPESALGAVGSYSTNLERDIDRSGVVDEADMAFAREAVLSAAEIGQAGNAWANDVDDSRSSTVGDVVLIRNRILGLD